MTKPMDPALREERNLARKAKRIARLSSPIKHDVLLGLLHYDPSTGVFRRIGCQYHPELVGREVGSKMRHGYIEVTFDGRRCTAHRLAFFYMTGRWPEADVDHINGIRDDNRWENLREATRSQNMQNVSGPQKNNILGIRGVQKHGLMFRAHIGIDGKRIRLGSFQSAQEAAHAYESARLALHERCPR